MKNLEKVGTYRVKKNLKKFGQWMNTRKLKKVEPWKVEKVGQWIGSWKFERKKKWNNDEFEKNGNKNVGRLRKLNTKKQREVRKMEFKNIEKIGQWRNFLNFPIFFKFINLEAKFDPWINLRKAR
jgi:hypothetical protein